MKFLLCIIITLLVVICEKGVPVKFENKDILMYFLLFIALLIIPVGE